jgi:hypothetical protein
LCAFLAPEPVPASWFPAAAAQLPAPLDERAADPVAWRQVLTRLGREALACVDHRELQMHRLTQAIVRGVPAEQAAATRERAGATLAANHPGDPALPGSWPGWAQLPPYVLALDPAATRNPGLGGLAAHAAWFLVRRGDPRGGISKPRSLVQARPP